MDGTQMNTAIPSIKTLMKMGIVYQFSLPVVILTMKQNYRSVLHSTLPA